MSLDLSLLASEAPEAPELRLDLGALDLAILFIFFAWVIGIGFALKRLVTSSLDFFLSGRSLPAWVTGLAFISANLGAIEILGFAASGAQYGVNQVHYYWIAAIPAMVLLGIVMMPFYYGSKVRSVPEYMRLRYDKKAHLINAVSFVAGSLLIAGVNLFALATVLRALLGLNLVLAVVLSAGFVLTYILLGGLTSAIYTEVIQFFVILTGLIPLVYIALSEVGGFGGLWDRLGSSEGESFLNPWAGLGFGGDSPLGDWVGLIFGLGFCLSFGYWTTNFAEVQRAMAAKDDNSARMTPIIGAFPKVFIPVLTVIPGMAALVLLPGIGEEGNLTYNDAIPALMERYLPTGALGIAITGLVAAFMAGMAANVSAFNAVFTYDIWQDYIKPGRPDHYYLVVGRWVTVIGVLLGIGTAFFAAGFSNISNYIQVLFGFLNVPLFTAFIIGMFWRRASSGSGFWGILIGTASSITVYILYQTGVLSFRSDLHQSMWGAMAAFACGALAMMIASRMQRPKPDEELRGLVHGLEIHDASDAAVHPWHKNPVIMGGLVLLLSASGYALIALI
jgi:solute:Na+ symporter, SSS family